jgi:hypothetical protein
MQIDTELAKQIENEKYKLTASIMAAVKDFTSETGLYITGIEIPLLDTSSFCGPDKEYSTIIILKITETTL